jgi:hypothetical protein
MEPEGESLPAEDADYRHDSHEQKGVGVMMPIEHQGISEGAETQTVLPESDLTLQFTEGRGKLSIV